jgi:diaminopimelate epimerase
MPKLLPGIPFVKASACGNDFLLIDGVHAQPDLNSFARRICDRHEGVGADGVEWLFPDPHTKADVHARLFNADGSEAEISGNGTRCAAAFLADERGLNSVTVRTGAGLKTCKLIERNGRRLIFETAMGSPELGEKFSIKLAFREVTGRPVSMGNPHFVVFVDQFGPAWQAEAAEIGRHHDFKHGINVEFVVPENTHRINIRLFERGVGETQSSGTGSCAAAVAAIADGFCQSPVEVETPGGIQAVRWQNEVFLRGPVQLLCRGEFFV